MNAFEIIEREIARHSSTVIIGHIQPDGDCMGSSFGLFHLIRDNYGIEPVIVNQPIRRFDFLGEWNSPGSVDYTDALKIDHHLVVDSYGSWNIERQTSSCCQIIAEEAIEACLVISPLAAQALYMGMVTDTGRFAYSGVDERTLEVASLLLATGFDMPALISRIEMRNLDTVRFLAQCYNDMQISPKGVLWLYVKQETIDRFHLSPDMVSQALSVMRDIEGHPIFVLFADLDDRIRVEFRSDRIRIVDVAVKFGGGGHPCACGARLDSPDMIAQVVEELGKYMPS